MFNSVTRRPHIPREKALRRILISQGFEVPLEMPRPGPVPGSKENLEEEDDETGFGEEEMEEEDELEDDEIIDVPGGHLAAYIFHISFQFNIFQTSCFF